MSLSRLRSPSAATAHPHGLTVPESPFRSFWMGGYEGSDHVNGDGIALDMVALTGHDQRLDADYRRARRLGLLSLRESIGWRLAEPAPGCWDLSRAVRMAQAARRQGVQLLWTLMHYGVPQDLTLLDDALIHRFAAFAAEVARVLRPLCDGPRVYTPINEISFLTWAASATNQMGPAGLPRHPGQDMTTEGYLLKQRLVRAALAGMDAIRGADPDARFLHIEPVVHIVPQTDVPAHIELAQRLSGYQWQTFDMLSGRTEPHLGGHPEALDWLGVNHYHTSQWEVPSDQRLEWHLRDPRRQPLSALLGEVWRRYGRPLVVAETGHVGVGRAAWLHEAAAEARATQAVGVPLAGMCLYPLLDRPAWHDTQQWHRSGLWHVPQPDVTARHLNRPYACALSAWQRSVATKARPGLLVLLPCAWEEWRGQYLLDRWLHRFNVQLLEPPRAGAGQPLLRRHGLAPGAELLVLHGGGAAGWHAPPSLQQTALLDDALGREPLACWQGGCNGGWPGHGGWLAWAGEPLADEPAQLPTNARPPPPGSYEDDEVSLRLRCIPRPQVWVRAPAHTDKAALTDLTVLLCDAARRQPAWHWLVDDSPAPGHDACPPNLHWLGPVHISLMAGLAARVSTVLACDALVGQGHADRAASLHATLSPAAAGRWRACQDLAHRFGAHGLQELKGDAGGSGSGTVGGRPSAEWRADVGWTTGE